jgi:hypothetical protein
MTVLHDNLPFVTCSRCGQLMRLVRTMPRCGILPELHVFACPACGDIETKGIPSGESSLSDHRLDR